MILYKVYTLKNPESLDAGQESLAVTCDPEDLENALYGYLQMKKLYEIVSQTDPNFFKDNP